MAGYTRVKIVKEGDHDLRVGSVWAVCPGVKVPSDRYPLIEAEFEIYTSAPKECCEIVEE